MNETVVSSFVWDCLSKISFNTYIWHGPLFPGMYIICHLFNLNPNFSWLRSMLFFTIIAWIIGCISHHLLEKNNQQVNR